MDPHLPPEKGLYWEFYTAAVAVTEMCAQHGLAGESKMLGKYGHYVWEASIQEVEVDYRLSKLIH